MNDQPEIPEDSTRVRASGLPTAFDCAHRWEGDAMLKLWRPSSPRALLGSALHHGTAVFDLAKLQGAPIAPKDGFDAVVGYLQNAEDHPTDWRGSDLRPRQVEAIALDLYYRYATEWAPRVEYTAVELTVKPLTIDCGGGVKVTLTGSLDRLRVVKASGGKPRVRDLKSGRAAVTVDEATKKPVASTARHRAQIGVYEVLVGHTLGTEIDETSEVLGLSTTGKRPIAEATTSGCRELVVGTEQEPGLIDFLADNLRAGRFPPNPSSPLCKEKYCARWNTCRYRAR